MENSLQFRGTGIFIQWYFSHTKQFEVFLPSFKFILIILDL